MDCNQSKSQIKKKIPLWLAGELNAEEAELISSHVQSCTGCQSEAKFWQAVNHTMREDLENLKAPPGFTMAVLSRINQQDRITAINRISKKSSWTAKLPAQLKRQLATAAVFILLVAGSVFSYMQINNNEHEQIAKDEINPNVIAQPIDVQHTEKSPAKTEAPPSIAIDTSKQDVQELPPVEAQESAPITTSVKESTQTGTEQSGLPENSTPITNMPDENSDDVSNQPTELESVADETEAIVAPLTEPNIPYALLSTDKNRVTNSTLLQIKVQDLEVSRNLALQYINNSIAEYEILVTENTVAGSQETIKIVVNNNSSNKLQEELKSLGPILTSNTQQDNLNKKYNEKVTQYLTLQSQSKSAMTQEEAKQFQVKMAGIEAQLKALDKEAETDTIILWLKK